ncbi:MAG: GNAT family N-acetyltransferase [Paraburkholderia sp.]|jgi:GNAT superfamily N-acetyltransferase
MSSFPFVRVAQPADAAALHSLYRQLVDDENVHVAESQIQKVSEDVRTRLFVCEVDGHAKATVLVSLCTDVMYGDQPFAVVENLVVDKAYRGQGFGFVLLRTVEQFCLSQNCSKMMLLSSATRAEAHRFFERFGFRSDLKKGFLKYRRQFAPALVCRD